jgi:hypothetical protein
METTSILVTFCLYALSTRWNVLSRLQRELDEACDSHDTIGLEQVNELIYLDAVIRESESQGFTCSDKMGTVLELELELKMGISDIVRLQLCDSTRPSLPLACES